MLSGAVPAGGHYLVQEAAGAGGTTPLPTPDATGSIAMSATAGKVALVTASTALTCGADCDTAAGVQDFVGYGSANDFETAAAPGLSNTTAALRGAGPDTDNNAADFTAGAPNPRNSGGAPPPDPGEPGLRIHDIQGAAHRSPQGGRAGGRGAGRGDRGVRQRLLDAGPAARRRPRRPARDCSSSPRPRRASRSATRSP